MTWGNVGGQCADGCGAARPPQAMQNPKGHQENDAGGPRIAQGRDGEDSYTEKKKVFAPRAVDQQSHEWTAYRRRHGKRGHDKANEGPGGSQACQVDWKNRLHLTERKEDTKSRDGEQNKIPQPVRFLYVRWFNHYDLRLVSRGACNSCNTEEGFAPSRVRVLGSRGKDPV